MTDFDPLTTRLDQSWRGGPVKALAYEKAHALDAFALDLIEIDEPEPRDRDLLVEIQTIGVNPGEAFIRSIRSAEPGGRVIPWAGSSPAVS